MHNATESLVQADALGANVQKAAFIPCRFGHCSTTSSNHGRISPHVAIPGYELVPTLAVHALRKLIAAGRGHLVQSRQYWAACLTRPPPSPLFMHAAVRDVRRSVPNALSEYRDALQMHDRSPESRPVATLNQSQTQLKRLVATGLGMQRAPDTYVRSAAYDQPRDM